MFQENVCIILSHKNNIHVARAFLAKGVYKIDMKKDCLSAGSAVRTRFLWYRLGHLNSMDLNIVNIRINFRFHNFMILIQRSNSIQNILVRNSKSSTRFVKQNLKPIQLKRI